MRRAALAIAVSALLAGACGEPAIPRAAAQNLHTTVARIRAAVEGGRIGAARVRLANLSDDVAQLLQTGAIDDGTAMEILDAAAGVRAALDLAPVPSSPTESTSPSPSPETDEGGGHAYGHDKGNGDEGHGND